MDSARRDKLIATYRDGLLSEPDKADNAISIDIGGYGG